MDVNNTLRELGLRRDDPWILNGSAVLELHGINPRPLGDIDIFCATQMWFGLLFKTGAFGNKLQYKIYTTSCTDDKRRFDPPYLWTTIDELEIHFFFGWRVRHNPADYDVKHMFETKREIVMGWPCVTLSELLAWKVRTARPKDLIDVAAILNHVKSFSKF